MSDCNRIVNIVDTEPESFIIIFSKKKQIFWMAIRLLYMLISKSNRIGNDTHVIHLDSENGMDIEIKDET
jgi:hypothetical protein